MSGRYKVVRWCNKNRKQRRDWHEQYWNMRDSIDDLKTRHKDELQKERHRAADAITRERASILNEVSRRMFFHEDLIKSMYREANLALAKKAGEELAVAADDAWYKVKPVVQLHQELIRNRIRAVQVNTQLRMDPGGVAEEKEVQVIELDIPPIRLRHAVPSILSDRFA